MFYIQQGVAIGLFVKESGKAEPATVHYADLWGPHGDWPSPQPGTKYFTLSETDISTTEWDKLEPHSPFYLFVPMNEAQAGEYEKGWKITDIFKYAKIIGFITLLFYFGDDESEVPLIAGLKKEAIFAAIAGWR